MDGTKKPWESKSILLSVSMGLLLALVPLIPGAEAVANWQKENLGMISAGWSLLAIALRYISKDKIQLRD